MSTAFNLLYPTPIPDTEPLQSRARINSALLESACIAGNKQPSCLMYGSQIDDKQSTIQILPLFMVNTDFIIKDFEKIAYERYPQHAAADIAFMKEWAGAVIVYPDGARRSVVFNSKSEHGYSDRFALYKEIVQNAVTKSIKVISDVVIGEPGEHNEFMHFRIPGNWKTSIISPEMARQVETDVAMRIYNAKKFFNKYSKNNAKQLVDIVANMPASDAKSLLQKQADYLVEFFTPLKNNGKKIPNRKFTSKQLSFHIESSVVKTNLTFVTGSSAISIALDMMRARQSITKVTNKGERTVFVKTFKTVDILNRLIEMLDPTTVQKNQKQKELTRIMQTESFLKENNYSVSVLRKAAKYKEIKQWYWQSSQILAGFTSMLPNINSHFKTYAFSEIPLAPKISRSLGMMKFDNFLQYLQTTNIIKMRALVPEKACFCGFTSAYDPANSKPIFIWDQPNEFGMSTNSLGFYAYENGTSLDFSLLPNMYVDVHGITCAPWHKLNSEDNQFTAQLGNAPILILHGAIDRTLPRMDFIPQYLNDELQPYALTLFNYGKNATLLDWAKASANGVMLVNPMEVILDQEINGKNEAVSVLLCPNGVADD